MSRWDEFTKPMQVTRVLKKCVCGGKGFFTNPDLPPSHPLAFKTIMCRCKWEEVMAARAAKLRNASGLSDTVLQRWTFAEWDPNKITLPKGEADVFDKSKQVQRAAVIKQRCMEYAQRPTGWLTLAGKYGTGKTHLLAAVAGVLLEAQVPVFFQKAPELIASLRRGSDNQKSRDVMSCDQIIQWCKDVTVLCLDDLGAQRMTEFARESLVLILDHRYTLNKATMITTNTPVRRDKDETLLDRGTIEPRILSRMKQGRVLTCTWGDFRSTKDARR